ncbi:MAG: DUF3857 domain-containing protein [Roseivirga sp.]|nr:DUF3857 domain-containing protein [Roseivirga sp.]
MSGLTPIKAALLSSLLILSFNLLAQSPPAYDWEPDRQWTTGIAEDDESLIMIKNHVQYDYVYEGNNLIVYQTYHKIYRVNNDEAVQRVNRIYIPLNSALDIPAVKARTISKEGKVTELDKNNIKEVKDEDAGAGYKIFAIEGAEVGGEIEYFYTKKASANIFGREFFQYGHPVLSTSFKFSSPANLRFEFKSYNGFAEVVQDDAVLVKNEHTAEMGKIAPRKQEDFGSLNANRQRIEFKLSYNKSAGNKRLFTWSDAGARISGVIYPFTTAERQAVKDFLKDLKIKKLKTPLEQFAFAEHHIKTTFYIDDNASDAAEQVENVIKNQFTTQRGFTRLFVAILEELEIKNEIVLTSDRKQSVRFDGDFESWNYLSDYFIYLTDADKFMAPYHFEFRLGLWPAEFSATEGLFIKNTTFEGTSVPIAQIKMLPEMPYTNNYDQMVVKVGFSSDLSENIIELERGYNGYEGQFIKSIALRANAEQKTDFLESLLQFVDETAEFTEKGFSEENLGYDTWSDYIRVKGTFNSTKFIEQAGDIILFKAGDLIGRQSELYQEDERQNLIENDYNRGYLRTIEVDIPEGYSIQNPQDIDMDVEASDNGRVVYMFKSTHEIKGNKLLISIDEYYDQVFFPVARFEEFRKVINAAADWNKIVLVMQPN